MFVVAESASSAPSFGRFALRLAATVMLAAAVAAVLTFPGQAPTTDGSEAQPSPSAMF